MFLRSSGIISATLIIIVWGQEPRQQTCHNSLAATVGRIVHANETTLLLSNSVAPWDQARQICHRSGMTLVEVEDRAKQDLLESHFNEVYTRSLSWVWTGASSQNQSSLTNYVYEGSGRALSFTNWAGGNPDGNEARRCVAVNFKRQWYNIRCDSNKFFACECRVPGEH